MKSIHSAFNRYVARSGVKVPIHAHHGLHYLRATVATKLLSAHVSPDIIFSFPPIVLNLLNIGVVGLALHVIDYTFEDHTAEDSSQVLSLIHILTIAAAVGGFGSSPKSAASFCAAS